MLTKHAEIAKVAKERPQERFTSLAHLVNAEMLRICHEEMPARMMTTAMVTVAVSQIHLIFLALRTTVAKA